ncbi:hypothetical protein [Devosia naphthalenivorans]|uniref:hypothetical protein n=1 Tax=Devosia naphthalenivorans TaxID=2082392 RepID=UPI001963B94A|nr:hypothetical protein [Devosia naphthalenivorans]
MLRLAAATLAIVAFTSAADAQQFGFGQKPIIVSPDGTYLGEFSSDQYAPDSISNPYGRYGSEYSPDSVNNPYGKYGSEYSPYSASNPYATEPPKLVQPCYFSCPTLGQ